jgi:hypothetical protein
MHGRTRIIDRRFHEANRDRRRIALVAPGRGQRQRLVVLSEDCQTRGEKKNEAFHGSIGREPFRKRPRVVAN